MAKMVEVSGRQLLHLSRPVLFLLALLCALSVGAQVALATEDPSAVARQVVELTNQERAKAGPVPLQWSDVLAAGTASHARDMAERGYFSHTSPEGTTPGDRAKAAGYQSYEGGLMFVGENLAKDFPTAEAVLGAWMNSPGHRANILLPEYREIGVAVVTLPDGRSYWAQEFGDHPREATLEQLSAEEPSALSQTEAGAEEIIQVEETAPEDVSSAEDAAPVEEVQSE